MRTMFVWRSAARLPRIIDAAASTQSTGCQVSRHGEEAEEDDREQRHEAAGLRRDREERGDRGRRAFVGVRRPEVERDRADLEREPDEGQEDRDDQQRLVRRRAGTAARDVASAASSR